MAKNPPQGVPKRPLSPHLQIWRWSPTMALSIFHRATGTALAFGLLLLTAGLVMAASGAESYTAFLNFTAHPLIQLALLGWVFALFFHMGTGLRHLLMDTGNFLTPKAGDIAAGLIFFFAGSATLITALMIEGVL